VSCFGVNKSEEVEQRQSEVHHHRTASATYFSPLSRIFLWIYWF